MKHPSREFYARGMQLVVVGRVRSHMRDPARRDVLFELDVALREVHERDGKSPLSDRLVKTRTDLLR